MHLFHSILPLCFFDGLSRHIGLKAGDEFRHFHKNNSFKRTGFGPIIDSGTQGVKLCHGKLLPMSAKHSWNWRPAMENDDSSFDASIAKISCSAVSTKPLGSCLAMPNPLKQNLSS